MHPLCYVWLVLVLVLNSKNKVMYNCEANNAGVVHNEHTYVIQAHSQKILLGNAFEDLLILQHSPGAVEEI